MRNRASSSMKLRIGSFFGAESSWSGGSPWAIRRGSNRYSGQAQLSIARRWWAGEWTRS